MSVFTALSSQRQENYYEPKVSVKVIENTDADDLGLLILLSPPSKYWGYRHVSLILLLYVYAHISVHIHKHCRCIVLGTLTPCR